MEKIKSFFTLDEPIGRWNFFVRNIVLLVCSALLLTLLPQDKASELSLIILVYTILFVIYYVFIITIMKRFWDILSDKTKAIIYGLILTLIAPVIPIIGAIFSFFAFFFLFLKKGYET
jgi:hypothetical protein